MNDVRDTKRIRTLPDDLREIANKMLEEKFQLASQGDVVEKKPVKAPDLEKTETHPFLDPQILDVIQRLYYEARRNGGYPDTLYTSYEVKAELLRDKRVMKYASYSSRGEPIIMGMTLKSESSLTDNRYVFVDNYRVVLDSRDYTRRYNEPTRLMDIPF